LLALLSQITGLNHKYVGTKIDSANRMALMAGTGYEKNL
jgi:hypothetical protein